MPVTIGLSEGDVSADPAGLYDLTGNTKAWCEDLSNGPNSNPTVRGTSCLGEASVLFLSSRRESAPAKERAATTGFRIVLVL